MSEQLDRVLERLHGVRRSGHGYVAQCPAHDDSHPSLSISDGTDVVLVRCMSQGCSTEAIVTAIGLTTADLRFRPNPRSAPQTETVYEYRDATGRLLYEKVRTYRNGKKSFYFRGPDGTLGVPKGTRHVLYRLPELLAAITAGHRIYVVEGEKDTDRLISLGLKATTNDEGAGPGKFRLHYVAELMEASEVAILPDNDAEGLKRGEEIRAQMPENARVILLPGLGDKEDVSDWLDQGHRAAELVALVNAAFNAPPAAPATVIELRARRLTDVLRDPDILKPPAPSSAG